MKTSFKFATLAALTAATLALPVAAQDMKDGAKCAPKVGTSKCATKPMKKSKCAAKCSVKCAPKCAAKCGAKCAPKK
jgi:hypothetical protein